jgi:hypothetical protein
MTANRAATWAAVVVLTAACGQQPTPGWQVRPVVPTSQQQAQDTVLGYLKKTLQALPTGTVFDRSRLSGLGQYPV